MGSARIVMAAVFGSLTILGAVGCKGDGGTGGSGGGGAPQNAPVVLPPNPNGQSCQNGDSGSCADQASVDEYGDCIVQACDSEYKQCFGNDYLTGSYGGPCQGLMECAIACQDCDQTCLQACSEQHFAGACQDCITGPIVSCVISSLTGGTCKIPCGPSSSGGVCDDLKTCCNSLADANEKQDCLTAHGTVSLGGDAACGATLNTYTMSGKCQ
jgi:hypothetical protein